MSASEVLPEPQEILFSIRLRAQFLQQEAEPAGVQQEQQAWESKEKVSCLPELDLQRGQQEQQAWESKELLSSQIGLNLLQARQRVSQEQQAWESKVSAS